MSLRLKFTIAMVTLAAAATIAVGLVGYAATSKELRDQVDASLVDAARRLASGLPPVDRGGPSGGGDRDDYRDVTQILVQVIDDDGDVVRAPAIGPLPVSDGDLRVAAGESRRGSFRHDVVIEGDDFRMLTVAITSGGAVQFARSLEETQEALGTIRNQTLLIVLSMSALAAIVGIVIAQQVTRRLVRLTEVATSVATSRDLDVAVPVEGRDETGRLGLAFNEMLTSLASSRRAQQQLVQDAGHELRTPLTSLRTNVRVMQRYDELSPASRERLLADVESETKELTSLVNELVELATDRRDDEVVSTVVLADVVRTVIERARRRSGRAVDLVADESCVVARPHALERAVSNLIENALKFSSGPIEVVVNAGAVSVADRGPGIADADLPRLFDRFYRSDAARALPGSGLGLSIVREMAEIHGGTVSAANRDGGGAVIGFRLPPITAGPDRPDGPDRSDGRRGGDGGDGPDGTLQDSGA
jgi:two-component system sensor histidine kinase MprB